MSDDADKIKLELPSKLQTFSFTFETKRPGPMTVEISLRRPTKRPRLLQVPDHVDLSATEPETPDRLQVMRWQEAQKYKKSAARIHAEETFNSSDTEKETPPDFTRWYKARQARYPLLSEGKVSYELSLCMGMARASRVALNLARGSPHTINLTIVSLPAPSVIASAPEPDQHRKVGWRCSWSVSCTSVKKLLGNIENPEEEEIESLCMLLKMVGQLLDTPKACAHMDVYFTRMKELGKSLNVSSRMQFMLQDVIVLHDRKWVSWNAVAALTTITAVHELTCVSPNRNQERGPDSWAVAGGSSVPRAPPKAGDLSQFGKITKGLPMAIVMGPSGVFAAGKKDSKWETLSRTNSSLNMFHMLSQNPELAVEASLDLSFPPMALPSC
ncbi:hypothetical protein EDD22DRAFT_1053360 [Suillus occidentalis]|nr:hypothetical protein EDD22DRAFT_1053360 [Suillus occidentalis]